MAPKRWATPAQTKFLTARLAEYIVVSKGKKYQDFWKTLTAAWFKEFPEIEKRFPGKSVSDLSADEEKALGKAMKLRFGVK